MALMGLKGAEGALRGVPKGPLGPGAPKGPLGPLALWPSDPLALGPSLGPSHFARNSKNSERVDSEPINSERALGSAGRRGA